MTTGSTPEAGTTKQKLFDLLCKECGTAMLAGLTKKDADMGVKRFYDNSTQETCLMIETHIARHGADMRSTYSYLDFYSEGYRMDE